VEGDPAKEGRIALVIIIAVAALLVAVLVVRLVTIHPETPAQRWNDWPTER
jgi:hypothetical protein